MGLRVIVDEIVMYSGDESATGRSLGCLGATSEACKQTGLIKRLGHKKRKKFSAMVESGVS